MNLALYCSVAEACRIAGVSKSYMHALIASGRVKATKMGHVYAVLRSSVQAFERQPGMGRPPKRSPARRPARPAKPGTVSPRKRPLK